MSVKSSFTFSTGRDGRLIIQNPVTGQNVTINNVTVYSAKDETDDLKIKLMSGVTATAYLPNSVTGSIELVRGDASIEEMFAQIRAQYLNSGTYSTGSMWFYVTEADGSQTSYQYLSVAMKLEDWGSYQSDKEVRQKIAFGASRCWVNGVG